VNGKLPLEKPSEEIRFEIRESSLDLLLVAFSAKGLCAVLLGDDRRALRLDLQERFPNATIIDAEAEAAGLAAEVLQFVESPQLGLDVSLDLRGTAFQRRVWRALLNIPVGTTASYTEIAQRIGMPKGARAVARACAANSLAIVVPCHRVVKSDGKLSGYRWGVERKKILLRKELEASA
jgi:O-6-methylguanine DNA methyltransferase